MDDVKSAWLLRLGLHTCYNGENRGTPSRETELIPQHSPQFRLKAATRLHEAGIASKRLSATGRWIRSRVLYSPPVKPWELAVPKASLRELRQGQWLRLSRNKAWVAEAAHGSPPFWRCSVERLWIFVDTLSLRIQECFLYEFRFTVRKQERDGFCHFVLLKRRPPRASFVVKIIGGA